MPALEAAVEALNCLKRSDITEMKAYKSPPTDVVNVLKATITLLGKGGADWKVCCKEMSDPNFIKKLICFDKDNCNDATIAKVEKNYTSKEYFQPQILRQKSCAAASIC